MRNRGVSLVYEPLVGSDPRTGQIAPTALADYWEPAPDNRTYTVPPQPECEVA